MGMELSVKFAAEGVPPWPAVRDLLAGRGFAVQMRMIDGDLSFPEEEPPATWRELRVGTAAGMVTLRREGDQIHLIIWGNAEAGLQQLWNTLTWAYAEAGGGVVVTSQASLTAAEFQRQVIPSL